VCQWLWEQQIRTALEQHGSASAVDDMDAKRYIYQENAVCEYPESVKEYAARKSKEAERDHRDVPGGFIVCTISCRGNLWVTEYVINRKGRPVCTIGIMEFERGKCWRESQCRTGISFEQ
jgi:hypothetical protein